MPEVVIVDPTGTEHHFPEGFDPVRAAGIVRQSLGAAAQPAPTPQGVGLPMGSLDASNPAVQQTGADMSNLIVGAGKSVMGALQGARKLNESAANMVGTSGLLKNQPAMPLVNTQPSNTAQSVGKFAGDTAMFFAPGSALGKAKAALATGSGILDALIGAGLEGASAAGVSSIQKGTTEGAGKTAALTGLAGAGLHGVLAGGNVLGQRVEQALVKPSIADVKNGFHVSNIFKYNLGGSLSQTYDKADAALKALSSQLQGVLKMNPGGGAPPHVDVLGAIADVAADLTKNAAKTFGTNAGIENAVNKLLDDPMFSTVAKTGVADLPMANQIKQAVGDLGAWLHDPAGRVMRDPDSKGMEVVANALYSKLKTDIEQKSIGPIRAINKSISDVMAVRQAVARRIPVEQRANVLNLGDLLSFSTGTYGLALANRLFRSGQAANAMVKAGEQAVPAAAGLSRTVAAGASQVP